MATQAQRYGLAVAGQTARQTQKVVVESFTVTIVDGAAAGTFALPAGALVEKISFETPTAIPGTPTNTNLKLGSAAAGAEYVANTDVKAQGWIDATIVYAGRNPASTVHYTVTSSGGTASAQDGTVYVHVEYAI